MSSPAGLAFCVVPHQGERQRPGPTTLDGGVSYSVDQVCIDTAHDRFDEEAEFWAALTGWELKPGALPEFSYLVRPSGGPVRLLLQRLGIEDVGPTRAHLDLACGDQIDAAVLAHEELGASVVQAHRWWTTMRDPTGLAYCLTRRDPITGTLPLR